MIYNNYKKWGFTMLNKLYNVLNHSENDIFNSLYDDMSSYQKNIFNRFKTDKEFLYNYSLNDLVFDFDTNFIQKLLALELELYLKENGAFNKKNGTTKEINLKMGLRTIAFNRPRLRHEKNFDSVLIPKRTRVIDDLNDNIILLYSKNNSINDIKEILANMFNIDLSNAYISNIAQELSYNLMQWRNKQLKSVYFTVNIDCLYITVRDNKNLGSHKIPVYIAVGTTISGHKEIVGMYLGNEDENKNIIDSLSNQDISESTSFWRTVFNDLKDRGVKKILYVVSDGVSGIESAVKEEFPDTFYQRCVVHLVRNLKKYTTKSDCKEIIADFKKIYSAPNLQLAQINADEFLDKFKNKKTMIKHAKEYISYIMPLFNLPENIRKYIYTNNIVESVNSKVQRGFYGRGALPNCSSALNIIYVNLIDLEKKWSKSKVPNWNNIFNELSIVHNDIINTYLNENL